MSNSVLKVHGLNALANRIRDRFKDDLEDIVDIDYTDDVVKPSRLDERERKWAAQKLLEPMEQSTAIDETDDVEFELEVLQEYWKLVTETSWGSAMTPEQGSRMASQYRHTKAYVATCWNLAGVDAPPEGEDDRAGCDPSLLKPSNSEVDDDEDLELDLEEHLIIEDDFDIDSLFEDLEFSEDDEDEDSCPEGEDADEVSDEEEQASAQEILDEAGISDGEPLEIPF